jgi:argininosuccinate lyase
MSETPAEQCIDVNPCKRIVTFILEAILQDHARKFMPSSSHLSRSRQTRFAVHSNLAYPLSLLCNARNLKETLSGLDISHSICL